MKVDVIKKDELDKILGSSRLITDVYNAGWRVEVYAMEAQVCVLVTGNGGDFECAQLASAFHSAYKHLFNPDHEVTFFRVPIGYGRSNRKPKATEKNLWSRMIDKSLSSIARTVDVVRSSGH